MNYLGHLYFSGNDTELMTANLFGDFVKGSNLSAYPDKIQEGIRLHRAIDHYIDTLPVVLELYHELYASLPKVTSVAVDLYFDHLLAKNWEKYHGQPLTEYLNAYYAKVDLENETYTPEFKLMMHRLIEFNWISYYGTLDGLDKACNGVSARISFPNELKNGLQVFLHHKKRITAVFEEYMQQATEHFFSWNSK